MAKKKVESAVQPDLTQEEAPKPTELALLPPTERAAIALDASATETKLRELVKSSVDLVAVVDQAGREQMHRAYMVLKNKRVDIEHTEKGVTEDAKKFTKAVNVKATELIAIITPEEDRLKALRDGYDDKVRLEKEEADRRERERVDTIKAKLAALRDNVPAMVGKSYLEINQRVVDLAGEFPKEESEWAEFLPRAIEVNTEVVEQLKVMASAQLAIEMAARLAAQQAKEEAERVAAQAEANRLAMLELERQRAELAAQAKKIADDKAATDKAEAEARAERDRIEKAERDAEDKRQADEKAAADAAIKKQQDELAEREAAFQRKLDQQAAEEQARVEAERVAAMPTEHVVELIEGMSGFLSVHEPAPPAIQIVTSAPRPITAKTEEVASTILVDAFLNAAKALLAVQSADFVMNLLDDAIDEMMIDDDTAEL